MPLCACGCGGEVTWNKSKKEWNKFIHGHHMRVAKYRKNSSDFHKQRFKDHPELRKEISNRQKKNSYFHVYNKTKEHSKKVSESNRKRKLSEETKNKIANSLKGHKQSERTKLKRRIKLIDNNSIKGENNPSWKGGISPRKETGEWIKLSKEIKKRDNYTCQKCGSTTTDLHVHHIDFDKSNHVPLNLITLCRSCHLHLHFKQARKKQR